ncbi:MAG: SulP family inorganic anion transporter [Eubacteriales bacterium]|nr:SulP family inorganic anion transporter [Eubacteriales bacterium]
MFSIVKELAPKQFLNDIIAGIVVAIIALPLSIALALASGVEPVCGIYTAIAAGFIVSLLGGSRIQIAGPTAAFATIVAGIVATQGMDGLFIATILAGIILMLMGVFKLGSLIKFIPSTITTGFTAGIAVTIFIGQIKDFLGIQYSQGVSPIETIEKLVANFEFMSTLSFQALFVGVVCLGILIIYPKFEKRVPPSLVSVIVGVLMVKFIPALDKGVFTINELYTVKAGLPSVDFAAMDFSLNKIMAVMPNAFTIAILAAIESLLSCVVADGMVNSKHNSNMELVAQGAGNIASVLFGGIPATGAIARTAANAKNGGRTPIAGMVHAVVLLIILLFAMPLAGLIPMPAIAAILFMVAYNMSEGKNFAYIIKTAPKSDSVVMVVTFALTVIFDLVIAIEVGLLLALILFMKRMSDEARVACEVKDKATVYEISGPMFFGMADKIAKVKPTENTNCVILHMDGVVAIDATAINSLKQLHKKCKGKGVKLALSHVSPQPMKAMKKSGFYESVGEENFYNCVEDALLVVS